MNNKTVEWVSGDMTLLDYFAIHAPEPDISDISLERSYDLNKTRLNEKFIARDYLQIRCELRYKYAREMMKARDRNGKA